MSGSGAATVLVVDDEPGVVELYEARLRDAYDVRTARDGETALEKLDGVDVVLLDRRMPGRSGDEILDRIRDRQSNCQVVMVTAVEPDFDIIEMPFDDYLVKPIQADELRRTVDAMVNRLTYEDLVQEYFRLTSTYVTLEAHKASTELDASEEFSALRSRLGTVRRQLDDAVEQFEPADFRVMFHELVP